MIVSDFGYCLFFAIFMFANLETIDVSQRWHCFLSAFIPYITGAASFSFVLFAAADRYLSIIRGYSLSNKLVTVLSISTWCFLLLLNCLANFVFDQPILKSSHLMCVLNYESRQAYSIYAYVALIVFMVVGFAGVGFICKVFFGGEMSTNDH